MTQDDLASNFIVVTIHRANFVHDGLRQARRVAVVENDGEIGLLMRMKGEVASYQINDSIRPLSRIFVRVVEAVVTGERWLMQGVIADGIGESQQLRLLLLPAQHNFRIERVCEFLLNVFEKEAWVAEVNVLR